MKLQVTLDGNMHYRMSSRERDTAFWDALLPMMPSLKAIVHGEHTVTDGAGSCLFRLAKVQSFEFTRISHDRLAESHVCTAGLLNVSCLLAQSCAFARSLTGACLQAKVCDS